MHAKTTPRPIPFPLPAPCAAGAGNVVASGEPVTLTLRDGTELKGLLRQFNLEAGTVSIALERQPAPRAIGLEEVKLLRLPRPRSWLSNPGELGGPPHPHGFALRFKDGTETGGATLGSHEDRWGLYLFPVAEPDGFQTLFAPHDFIEERHQTPHVGGMVVVHEEPAEEPGSASEEPLRLDEEALARLDAPAAQEPVLPEAAPVAEPPEPPEPPSPPPAPAEPFALAFELAPAAEPAPPPAAPEELQFTLIDELPPMAREPEPEPERPVAGGDGEVAFEIDDALLAGIDLDADLGQPALFGEPERPPPAATEAAEPDAAAPAFEALAADPDEADAEMTAAPQPWEPPQFDLTGLALEPLEPDSPLIAPPPPKPRESAPPAAATAEPSPAAAPSLKLDQSQNEQLRTKAVTSSLELERALERQKSAPNLKLGEILQMEGLITEEQLHAALAEQKKNRKVPLGELLVQQGAVKTSDIQLALAKKLSIPFVEVTKFDVDYEAVELVPQEMARKFRILPLALFKDKLVVAMENPMAWEPLDAVRFHTKKFVEPVMASAEEIEKAITAAYSPAGLDRVSLEDYQGAAWDEEAIAEESVDEASVSDNVVVKLVNKIIYDAYQKNASDIHIEPYGQQKTVVRIRRDGTLMPYFEVPTKLRSAVIARIKIMAGLDISERRKPQDGKIDFRKFGGPRIELRVATIPTAGGLEDVVMRILASNEPLPIERLGLTPTNLERLRELIHKPYGLFLVCGPTGSGKTTTLHSLLAHLNTSEAKIWTAEDPVEITQKGLRQVQINPKIGLTFAAAMRSFLRADPDIIMVGEMRDQETTKIALEASLTGHLVLATLHTNSAPESITRLLDMGMDPFNFADALIGVLSQRLTKRFCAQCKEPYEPDAAELNALLHEYTLELAGDNQADPSRLRESVMQEWRERYAPEGRFTLYRAKGCDACANTGYRGRMGIHELLTASPSIKRMVVEHAPVYAIFTIALREGMRTLKQDGIDKVLQGLTDIQQVRKVCVR